MPKPNGAPNQPLGIGASPTNIPSSAAPTLDVLNRTNPPNMAPIASSPMQQPDWGIHPGTDLSANPNNNFILQALGGQAPGYNPNYDSQVGVPNANTPAINSQTTPAIGSMPQANQGVPLSNNSMGRAYG